jgi:hypothetical protein
MKPHDRTTSYRGAFLEIAKGNGYFLAIMKSSSSKTPSISGIVVSVIVLLGRTKKPASGGPYD